MTDRTAITISFDYYGHRYEAVIVDPNFHKDSYTLEVGFTLRNGQQRTRRIDAQKHRVIPVYRTGTELLVRKLTAADDLAGLVGSQGMGPKQSNNYHPTLGGTFWTDVLANELDRRFELTNDRRRCFRRARAGWVAGNHLDVLERQNKLKIEAQRKLHAEQQAKLKALREKDEAIRGCDSMLDLMHRSIEVHQHNREIEAGHYVVIGSDQLCKEVGVPEGSGFEWVLGYPHADQIEAGSAPGVPALRLHRSNHLMDDPKSKAEIFDTAARAKRAADAMAGRATFIRTSDWHALQLIRTNELLQTLRDRREELVAEREDLQAS